MIKKNIECFRNKVETTVLLPFIAEFLYFFSFVHPFCLCPPSPFSTLLFLINKKLWISILSSTPANKEKLLATKTLKRNHQLLKIIFKENKCWQWFNLETFTSRSCTWPVWCTRWCWCHTMHARSKRSLVPDARTWPVWPEWKIPTNTSKFQ